MLRGQRGQAEGRERPPKVGRWDGAGASASGTRNPGIPAARADTPWRRRPAQASPRPAPAAQGGGPAERPPRRRSLGRRREHGPGWRQEGSSPRRGPLGQRLQPPTARGRALSLTAPDPQLQLGLVQVGRGYHVCLWMDSKAKWCVSVAAGWGRSYLEMLLSMGYGGGGVQ